MNEHSDDTLARFFDGELPADQAANFTERLEADEALAAELARLNHLRDALREHIDDQVQAADFSGFFAAVSAGVGELHPTPSRPPSPAGRTSAWERTREWWSRYWTPVLVSAAAAAAVALIVVRAGGPGGEGVGEGVETNAPITVEAVSNQGNQTVLISSPAGDSGGATVIWMLDDEVDEMQGEDASLTGEDPI